MTSGEYDDLIIVTMIGIKITDEEKYKKMMAQGPFLVFAETLEVGTELKVKHCFTFLYCVLLPFNPEVKFNGRKTKLWG